MRVKLIGLVIDHLYRYPKSRLQRYKSFGGWGEYRKMLYNLSLMKSRAGELPPVRSWDDGPAIYFLTGKKYWYQTLFCIQSLSQVTTERFLYVLIDDGTLDKPIIEFIDRQLPGSRIITQSEIRENLDEILPVGKYPHLRAKREKYVHLRKLTDVHTIRHPGWKLVLDSDMLFWNRPGEIINWLQQPSRPIHMIDCAESYGYSRQLMESLCGSPVPRLLNVGVIGMNSQHIDWAGMDRWIKLLEENGGGSYYLEQALTAMLIGDKQADVLDTMDYIVNPAADTIVSCSGILHHYVDLSKKGYFNIAWKKIYQAIT